MPLKALLLVALLIAPTGADARSAKAKDEFRREQPCPATNRRKGPCKGYVIDHVVPLCACGLDAAVDMQWQTVEDGKLKDRAEASQCRRPRVSGP